jgi:uncharacterized protein
MNNYMKHFFYTIIIASACLLNSCSDDEADTPKATPFKRGEMLANYANNIIIPFFAQSVNTLSALQTKIHAFTQAPTQSSLTNARDAWKKAALAWQHCTGFNFGPAAEMGLTKSLNEEIATFPINGISIETYINAGDTSFNNFNRDTRGIYAIEYLLFGENITDQLLIERMQPKRKMYLNACINASLAKAIMVQNEWNSYKTEFIEQAGTDIGSSTSHLYNEFLKSFEGLKNFKFGIPLGRRPGQTQTLPQNVEAYYSGYSTTLANEHWMSIQNIWEGRGADGRDGMGLKEYLESVEGGNELITRTLEQMNATNKAFSYLPDIPLSVAIQQHYYKPDAVHTELQKLTRFYKSDLSSLIGIAVTYSSGDGD